MTEGDLSSREIRVRKQGGSTKVCNRETSRSDSTELSQLGMRK